jgi:putative sigma-54 modulation protein
VTLHVRGKDIFVEADSEDMYATLDNLMDKLDQASPQTQGKIGGAHA